MNKIFMEMVFHTNKTVNQSLGRWRWVKMVESVGELFLKGFLMKCKSIWRWLILEVFKGGRFNHTKLVKFFKMC